jgi:hypothetical protein
MVGGCVDVEWSGEEGLNGEGAFSVLILGNCASRIGTRAQLPPAIHCAACRQAVLVLASQHQCISLCKARGDRSSPYPARKATQQPSEQNLSAILDMSTVDLILDSHSYTSESSSIDAHSMAHIPHSCIGILNECLSLLRQLGAANECSLVELVF